MDLDPSNEAIGGTMRITITLFGGGKVLSRWLTRFHTSRIKESKQTVSNLKVVAMCCKVGVQNTS